MKNCMDSYRNANAGALSLLSGIPHTPVQRNNGIDAFLTKTYQGVPIPVRMQRHGETLADAASALHRAAKKKRAGRMVLIATEDQPALFDLGLPEAVVVVPSAALGIARSIRSIGDEATPSNKVAAPDRKTAPLRSAVPVR